MLMLTFVILSASLPNADQIIASAKPGDTVVLSGGVYPRVDIRSCLSAPGATLDATRATIGWLYMPNACHWNIKGGEYSWAPYVAIQLTGVSHVTVTGGVIHHWGTSGIAVGASSYVDIEGMSFSHSGGDAMDVVGSDHVTINENRGFDINYGAQHADFVQMWGGADMIQITNNSVICHCQGLDNYGNGQPNVITNLIVSGNLIATDTTTAANFTNIDSGAMVGNVAGTLSTMPKGWGGARWVMTARPGHTVQIQSNVDGATP